MIPRSLPPLPPQISYEPANEGDSACIVLDNSLSTKRPRPKRKNKSHSNSRNSHLRHGNITEEKSSGRTEEDQENLEHNYSAQKKDEGTSPLPDYDGKKNKAQKLVNLSILDRLKLKRQNSHDVEGNLEMCAEHTFDSSFSENRHGNLPLAVSSFLNGNVASQPIAKMFFEEERGFRAVSDFPGATTQSQAATLCDNPSTRGVQSAVEVAVKTEKFFHTFSTFCHGLLAGMALWQCIIVYQLGPPHFEASDFFSHYSSLSQPMQTLFYFFFVICIVSAFDRYDIGNPQCSNSKCTLACRSGIIIVIIYPISLLLSLGIANIDDKMSLHNYNASMWTNENVLDTDHDFFYWKILNLGRCIGAVVGWIIVALQPSVNSFLHRLEYVSCIVK